MGRLVVSGQPVVYNQGASFVVGMGCGGSMDRSNRGESPANVQEPIKRLEVPDYLACAPAPIMMPSG